MRFRMSRLSAAVSRRPLMLKTSARAACSVGIFRLAVRKRSEMSSTTRRSNIARLRRPWRAISPRSATARVRGRSCVAAFDQRYRLRKQIIEPVFGQIKYARGRFASLFCGAYSTYATGSWARQRWIEFLLRAFRLR
jgi:hypothetical protein